VPRDPEAFVLNIDIPDDNLKSQLVAALLTEVRAGRLYHDYSLNLTSLRHGGLAEQLRPALREPNREVVRMVIAICRRSKVTELVPDLTSLALDVRADGRLRVAAALAIDDLTRNAPTNGLVALLRSPDLAPDDEATAEELQAAAAMASWPHSLTTAEVFAFINPRHPRNYRGIYSIFVDDLAERLMSQDLDVACDWLSADLQRMDDSRLASLVDAIVKLCIEHIGVPKARRLIKHVAFRRADEYAPLFSDESSYINRPGLTVEDRHEIALLLFEDATENQVLSIAYTSGPLRSANYDERGPPLAHRRIRYGAWSLEG
jgi:hypothetical protein